MGRFQTDSRTPKWNKDLVLPIIRKTSSFEFSAQFGWSDKYVSKKDTPISFLLKPCNDVFVALGAFFHFINRINRFNPDSNQQYLDVIIRLYDTDSRSSTHNKSNLLKQVLSTQGSLKLVIVAGFWSMQERNLTELKAAIELGKDGKVVVIAKRHC